MITPTIGRKVWYRPSSSETSGGMNTAAFGSGQLYQIDPAQPMDATVVFVHNDRKVNLLVVDHLGKDRPRFDVTLLQGDETYHPVGGYAEWMPYQQGQAKKDVPEFVRGGAVAQADAAPDTRPNVHIHGDVAVEGQPK